MNCEKVRHRMEKKEKAINLSYQGLIDRQLVFAIMKAIRNHLHWKILKILFPIFQKFWGFRMVGVSELLSSGLECDVIQIGCCEEETYIRAPITVGEDADFANATYRRMIGQWFIGRPYIVIAQDVRLLGPFATAFTRDNGILSDTIAPENYRVSCAPASLSSLFMALLPPSSMPRLSGIYCSLVSLWSKSYFHWLVETLPRLEFIDYWKKLTGLPVKFIVDKQPTKWQLASLRLAGISDCDIVEWNGRFALVERLIVPSFPRRLCRPGKSFSVVSPTALKKMRIRILEGLSSSRARHKEWPQRIVISRRLAPGRRVKNEEEMMDFLKPLGFQSFCLEEMTFEEQIELFSSAEIVIGPHGAGLANIVFSNHLKVIELFSSYTNPSFFTLASSLGFDYGFLRCKAIRTLHPHRHDLMVDISALARLLRQMGVS